MFATLYRFNKTAKSTFFFSRHPITKIKLTLAADAGSLILLQRLGELDNFATSCRFQTTSLVLDELERGATAFEFSQFKENTVLIKVAGDGQDDFPRKLSQADGSVIALFRAMHPDALLADDRGILSYCKKQDIPHYCCLSLLALLVQLGLMPAEEAKMLFPRIAGIGRYSSRVVHSAKEMLQLACAGALPMPKMS